MISYDLIAGRRLSAPPQVRYTDRTEEWEILCTGRDLHPAVSWRASVATARKIDPATIIAETTEGITAADNIVLVPLDVFFATFRDAVADAEKGRELWFALWGTGADGKAAEYIEFQFTGFPAIDPPGEPPKSLPIRPTTTVNSLSGAVILADAAGNPFPVEGQTVKINADGGNITAWDYSAVTWPAVSDVTYGRVRYFDVTYPELFFAEIQDRVTGFRALVVSNDNTVSGNIVLIPTVADDKDFTVPEELDAIVIAVGTSLAEITFDLAISKKFLKFRRDYENELDTLADSEGAPITAIITASARRISNA